jgi:hypothetical protein
MAYTKTNWNSREGVNLNRFIKSAETDTSVILTNTPSEVTHPGTPFSAENMNHIEQGIEDAHALAAAETQAREQADTTLQGNINAEAVIRSQEDGGLQTQINQLEAVINAIENDANYGSFSSYADFTAAAVPAANGRYVYIYFAQSDTIPPEWTQVQKGETWRVDAAGSVWQPAIKLNADLTANLTDAGGTDTLKTAGQDSFQNWLQSFRNNIKSLLAKFNSGGGHKHNGTDSPQIAYGDITGTPVIPQPPDENRFIPPSGSAGQVLGKTSSADYAVGWINLEENVAVVSTEAEALSQSNSNPAKLFFYPEA